MQCKNCTTGSLLLIYTLIGCRTTWLSEVLFLLCECWELDLFQKSCLPGKVHKSNTECKNRKIGIKLHSNELINWGNLLRRQVGWGDSHVLDLWDCQYLQHSHFSCELSKWQKKKKAYLDMPQIQQVLYCFRPPRPNSLPSPTHLFKGWSSAC